MMGLRGLWQRSERVRFGGGHLSWVFNISKTFQPSMEAQKSASKLIELLLCLFSVFSFDIPMDFHLTSPGMRVMVIRRKYFLVLITEDGVMMFEGKKEPCLILPGDSAWGKAGHSPEYLSVSRRADGEQVPG